MTKKSIKTVFSVRCMYIFQNTKNSVLLKINSASIPKIIEKKNEAACENISLFLLYKKFTRIKYNKKTHKISEICMMTLI